MKSVLYSVTNSNIHIDSGGFIPLQTTVRRFGQNIKVDGNSVSLCGKGYYSVRCTMTFVPDTSGNVILDVLKNGYIEYGAESTSYQEEDKTVNLSSNCVVKLTCSDVCSNLSFLNKGVSGTLTNFSVIVEKL